MGREFIGECPGWGDDSESDDLETELAINRSSKRAVSLRAASMSKSPGKVTKWAKGTKSVIP